MSLFSGESSWLYGAWIGQTVRIFDLTGLEPNDILTYRMNCKIYNTINNDCHRTHEHNLYRHTVHRYSVTKTQCVQISQHVRFTRLYFSVLNRFISANESVTLFSSACLISAVRLSVCDCLEWTSDRLRPLLMSKCSSDQFLYFQKLLKLTSTQIASIELFLWLVEQNVSMIK
jgi:hypothetical protein